MLILLNVRYRFTKFVFRKYYVIHMEQYINNILLQGFDGKICVTTLNAEIVAREKYRAHLMSRKILCNLRDIFYAQHVVFHHCATSNQRDFFFLEKFFYIVS